MKSRVVGITLSIVGILMVSIATVLEENDSFDIKNSVKNNAMDIVSVINMSSANRIKKAEIVSNDKVYDNKIVELNMEQVPQSVYIPPRVEVYEGMTLEELGEKINRNLGNGYLSGKGSLIASKCIELGVDPYIVTAIILHETGCKYNCSMLVKQCNNVGGQKGAPGCGGGSYKYYATLDDGIIGHIENLYYNYFSKGRTTVEAIAPRYAASTAWSGKINWYVNLIRTN
ncbi:MAG: hypothetical protein Q4E39_01750 [bacterium]|nr:hypothetical protein [bacterium]